ncbi:RDD family protein [Haloarcula salina]|uniref:RDD family protein n=1 Tax=Haloarcula salina TaxID=1429914 RepID=A0AA41KJE5_9EURY|nr:RDD family protein [Haloarcula salina]MBV0900804.1 RDD family protein [Haloarcula salina]
MDKHPRANLEKKAGLGKRFAARFLDGLLIGVIFGAIFFVIGGVGGAASGENNAVVTGLAGAYLFMLIGFPFIYFLYHTIMEAMYGYTLGKHALGLVITDESGSDITWVDSIVRNVFRLVGFFFSPFSALLAVILIAVNDDEQRLGDMAGSTVVVEQA